MNMKRVLQTFVVFLSILASIVSEHGTHNAVRTSCDHNNGECSSTCLISTNEQGYSCACPPEIPLLSDKKTCAHEGHEFLLVADHEKIVKISLDDSNYAVEKLQLDGIGGVIDVDFDPLEGKIYWTEVNTEVIRRAYLNGSGQQQIVSTDLSYPTGIAIDYTARKLYWADFQYRRIEMSDLNGTNRKVIMSDESAEPYAIVVDTRLKRIYWTDVKKKRIESSSLDGTNRSVVIEFNEGTPTSLALDDEQRIIYWGYDNMEKMEMANVDGSDRRVLISNDLSYIYGLSLLGDYIYWTDKGKNVIERADKKTGDNRQVIVDNLHWPYGLKSIILRNIRVRTSCDHNNGECSSTCLISTNEQGYSCACPPEIPLLSDKKTCAHEGHEFLLVADHEKIVKISLDDSNYAVEKLQLDGIGGVIDVDFDPLEGKIYWTEVNTEVIRRAYLNGSGQQQIVSTDLSYPTGIAIDYTARKLYWADFQYRRIEMSDLNGTNRKVIMSDESAEPYAIVVDTRLKRIYWTDVKKKRIERSSLDGTNRSVVIEFNEETPTSLALDDEQRIIYWGYDNMEKMEMANVDGSDRRVLISNDLSYIYGLSLLGDYIYWTDKGKNVIERADKKTGDNRQVIVDNLHWPYGLKSIILRNIREQTCDSLVNPQHGYIRQLTNNNSANSVATFACHRGYSLVGEENTTCLWIDNKLQWSNPTPQCVKGEKCKGLSFDAYKIRYDPEPEVDFSTEVEYPNGTRATVTCDDGFEIFPLRPIVTNAATSVCVNGQWKPDIVNCTPARCSCTKLPQEMIERKRKLKYCDQFAPSGTYNQLTECEEGYKARGNYGARCAWGVWSIHTPVTQYYRCIRNKSVKDCHLDLKGKDDLTVLHRNHTFEGQEVDFVHLSIVKFSCKSFYSTLEGDKNVTCIDGQWSKEIPKCKQTSAFDLLYPPFLWVYFANFNRINTDDGRVMIPKETIFKIGCWSPAGRQLKVFTAGKQFLKVNISSEDTFSSVKVINPVREKTEATVECINSKGISTEFNIIIADTCEVNKNELNRRGLQVVPDSRQRIYVEGDRIQLECSSKKRRTDQFIMICKTGREWEYANNMVC